MIKDTYIIYAGRLEVELLRIVSGATDVRVATAVNTTFDLHDVNSNYQ